MYSNPKPTERTTAIHNLPPEIIQHIFNLLKLKCLKSSPNHTSSARRLVSSSWITVSHVSRKWRDLALSSSSLWSNIDLSRPVFAAGMLKRCPSGPLQLHNQWSPNPPSLEDCETVWRLLLPQISRLEELDLPEVQSLEVDVLESISAPMPLLRSIHICNRRTDAKPSLVQFLQKDMPSLRMLHINAMIIPRTLVTFPRLTTLRLFGGGRHLCVLTVSEIITSLETMPELEQLVLASIVSADTIPSTPSTSIQSVKMPKLKSLILSDHLDAAFVLSAVCYPLDAEVVLDFCTADYTPAGLLCILDACSLLKSSVPPINSLYIHFHPLASFALDAEDSQGRRKLSLNIRDSPDDHVLRQVLASLSPDTIHYLQINSSVQLAIWPDLVKIWTNIVRVDVDTSVLEFWPLLVGGLYGGPPTIQVLVFPGYSFEEALRDADPPIMKLLRDRKASGMPIPTVHLLRPKSHAIKPSITAQLRELGTEVTYEWSN